VRADAVSVENPNTEKVSPSWARDLRMVSIWHGRKKGREDPMKNVPVVDVTECSDCETCLELCPTVFIRNKETGFIETIELEQYPEAEICEVINYCPQDCISLEEG